MAQVAEANSKFASENRFSRLPQKRKGGLSSKPSLFAGRKLMLVSGRVNMSIDWHDILTGQESQAPSLCNSASLWCMRMLATTASREPTSRVQNYPGVFVELRSDVRVVDDPNQKNKSSKEKSCCYCHDFSTGDLFSSVSTSSTCSCLGRTLQNFTKIEW